MNRFVCFLVLFEMLARCSATTPIVNITIDKKDPENNRQLTIQSSPLMAKESFTISIRAQDSDILNNITCCFAENSGEIFLRADLTRRSDYYYASGVANARMNNKWICQITVVAGAPITTDAFQVKVRSMDLIPLLSVNNKDINMTATDVKETLFDARGDYFYIDGELAKITCNKNKANYMNLKVIYAIDPAPANITTEGGTFQEHTLYIKLTDAYNGSYLMCSTSTSNSRRIVRLYFNKITSRNTDHPSFRINDLELVPTVSTNDGNRSLEYYYEYYDGETLSILGTMPNTKDQWNCVTNTEYANPLYAVTEQKSSINLTVTLRYDISKATNNSPSMDCLIGPMVAKLELILTPVTYGDSYDPKFNGLSSANTLYRYKQTEMVYKVKYRHPSRTNLNLTCFSNDSGSKLVWDYDTTEVTAYGDRTFVYDNASKFYESKLSFAPRKDIIHTVIQCKKNNTYENTTFTNTAEILFEYQTSIVTSDEGTSTKAGGPGSSGSSAGSFTEPTSSVAAGSVFNGSNAGTTTEHRPSETGYPSSDAPTNTNNTTNMDAQNTDDPDDSLPIFIILGIVGAAILVIILVAWMVVTLIKRKRSLQKEEETNINYENLPDHNAGPMATPAQWNNYSPSLTQTEDPYSYVYVPTIVKPSHNMSASTPQHDKLMYATPKDQRPPDLLYAEVGAQSALDYASVLPKGQRNQTEYANSQLQKPAPEYSQIQPKKLRNNPGCAPQVLPRMIGSNYSQVLKKTKQNRPDDANYSNVFENPRYGNMDNQSEYAEPAYCEPNVNEYKQK